MEMGGNRCGPMWRSKFLCPPFVSSSIPLVGKNTLVLGVCGVDLEHAGPEQDGWFLSDFYAFNYLLKDLGTSQTWLAAADPRELLGKYGPFVHGASPHQERKVVLSEELLNAGEITLPRVVPGGGMVEAFFEELGRLGTRAGEVDDAEILILVFGHYQQVDKSVVVEYSPPPYPGPPGELKAYAKSLAWGQLLFPKIRDAVVGLEDTSVSLLTTACYSGGWELRRLRDGSRAEAGDVNGRSVGGEEKPGFTLPSFEDMGIRQILDATHGGAKFPRVHAFCFVGTDDSVVEFRRRWALLSESAVAATFFPLEEYQDSADNLGGLFGGTCSTQLNLVKRQARSHLDTCWWDWNGGDTMRRSAVLQNVAWRKDNPSRTEVQYALRNLKWRVAVLDLTDVYVRMLDLPRPDGQLCQEWNRGSPMTEDVRELREKIHTQILDDYDPLSKMTPGQDKRRDGKFIHLFNSNRPTQYMAACMALAGYDSDRVTKEMDTLKAWYCEMMKLEG